MSSSSVNGAYAGFQGQGNVGSVSVPVDETFDGTIVDYAFIRESATPNLIETYADGGAGLITYGSYVARAGGNLGNNSDMKLWTATDPGAPAFSSPADFTSSTGVGTFDHINGSVDISGVTVGSVYFFYSGYRSRPLFSATIKDAEMIVADVPLPVFGDGDSANNNEHYVCSINFVNNDGCDTIDWSLTSSLYNGDPHCSLKGIVLVSSTGQTATVPNVVGLSQSAAQSPIASAGFSVGTVLLRSSSTIPAGNVISQSPGNGSSAIEGSAVNLVVSNGPPTTAVPNVLGLEQSVAESQIVAEGLIVGSVTTEANSTVPAGSAISQSPSSGSFLVEGGAVDLVVSLGDTEPPTLSGADIVDDQGGGQVTSGTLVTYTVTFSEPMDAGTINPADFQNHPSATATVTVDSVAPTPDPAVFAVAVTPVAEGSLRLQVAAGADLRDTSANPLDTGSAINDVETLAVVDDYSTWSGIYPGADLSDPGGDFDGDQLTNNEERAWGLDPTSAASSNPIVNPLNPGGLFSYTRRDPALTGLTYSVWTSTDMVTWFEDLTALQNTGTVDANGVQTVESTLTPALLSANELFFRVKAE